MLYKRTIFFHDLAVGALIDPPPSREDGEDEHGKEQERVDHAAAHLVGGERFHKIVAGGQSGSQDFLNEQSKENVPKNIVNTIGRDVGDRHSGGRVESRGENAQ